MSSSKQLFEDPTTESIDLERPKVWRMVPYILVHALVRFHNLSYSSFFISLHSQLLLSLHLSPSLSNMEPQCLRLLIFGLAFSLMTLLQNPVHASTDPCNFPAIFNFGDSNSDTGGLSAAFGQASSPHGESYFHGPAGRYCDGRLLIDFMGTFFLLLF